MITSKTPPRSLLLLIPTALILFLTITKKSPQTTSKHLTSTRRNLQTFQDHTKTLERNAIVALVPNNEGDLHDFCLAIKSLSVNRVVKPTTPVLVYHEDDLIDDSKYDIIKCTNNPITFIQVEFDFPRGFDAEKEYEENWKVAARATNRGRRLWGYAQMIRFWTTGLWKHPAVKEFDTIMRIDTDSCFVSPGEDIEDSELPGMRGRYVYRSDGPGTGVNTWIHDLFSFTEKYMKKHKITPANEDLWRVVKDTWKEKKTLPVFGTNFEVNRVAFFLRPDVMKWHEALTEAEPFGVFRYRWGDAQTRVLTMALFAKKDDISNSVLLKRHPGYRHGRGLCAEYFGVPSAW
mmetsp:Transcript_21949/g.27154  ORF Transcript_21949/g.27154 Transcript_21949/m.27154 type:complete len:347 (-) Transcript_21949:26-1066(-)